MGIALLEGPGVPADPLEGSPGWLRKAALAGDSKAAALVGLLYAKGGNLPLYAEREAVVDGDLRLTYAQFLDRCDHWSSALQALGVQQGDRVTRSPR